MSRQRLDRGRRIPDTVRATRENHISEKLLRRLNLIFAKIEVLDKAVALLYLDAFLTRFDCGDLYRAFGVFENVFENLLGLRLVFEHRELSLLSGGFGLHFAEMIAGVLNLVAQSLKRALGALVALKLIGLDLTRRVGPGSHFGQNRRRLLERNFQIRLVCLKALVAHYRLARGRLQLSDLVAYLSGAAIALDGLGTGRLDAQSESVDLSLGFRKNRFRLVERLLRGGERIAQKPRLLGERLGLHLDIFELAARVGDFTAVTFGKAAVFLDTLGVDADNLVRALICAVGGSLLLGEKL